MENTLQSIYFTHFCFMGQSDMFNYSISVRNSKQTQDPSPYTELTSAVWLG